MGGGRERLFFCLFVRVCVCMCVGARWQSARGGGVDDDRLMGKAETGGSNMYAHAATVYITEWTKTCLAVRGGGGEMGRCVAL